MKGSKTVIQEKLPSS